MKLDLSRLNLDAAARTIINAAKAETVAVTRDVEQGSRERAPELTSDLVNSHKTQIVINSASGITVAAIGPGTGFIYHTGGMVGQGGMPSRSVPAGLFANAPRFHTGGLVSGEVPIIAKRGEAVFTPEQMDNADQLIRASQGGQTVTVNNEITVNGGSSGNKEQDQALAQRIGKEIENRLRVVVNSELRQQMRPGGMLSNAG